jgi:hypothetical protein
VGWRRCVDGIFLPHTITKCVLSYRSRKRVREKVLPEAKRPPTNRSGESRMECRGHVGTGTLATGVQLRMPWRRTVRILSLLFDVVLNLLTEMQKCYRCGDHRHPSFNPPLQTEPCNSLSTSRSSPHVSSNVLPYDDNLSVVPTNCIELVPSLLSTRPSTNSHGGIALDGQWECD